MWLTRERGERAFAILPADDASATWIARRSTPHPEGIALAPSAPLTNNPLFRVYSIADATESGSARSALVAELVPSEAAAGETSSARLDEACGVILLLPVATMAADPAYRLYRLCRFFRYTFFRRHVLEKAHPPDRRRPCTSP